MQPIATDTSDFGKIRQQGCVYVDKTAYFHQLITKVGNSMFFLARPRRFGKSLMISTFKAIFEGRRDLFQGLAIEKTDYDWQPRPVLQFNLGFCAHSDYADFAKDFPKVVKDALAAVGVAYDAAISEASNFGSAIDELAKRGPTPAILIDEYDDPVAAALKDEATAEKVRDHLAPFFRQMKDRSEKIRFVMITGVSKFTKMSVFSALSNLVDISFNDDCAAMLGFTEGELDKFFGEHLRAHAQKMKLADDAYRTELRRMYNGYRFWLEAGENVYNPVSVSLTLASPKGWFEGHWTQTGKASFLMNYLKSRELAALDLDHLDPVSANEFDVSDLRHLRPVAMLFQTGYLTLSGFNPRSRRFSLAIPNAEVREDLGLLMASVIAEKDTLWAEHLGGYLLEADFPRFFEGLRALYSGLAYGSTENRPHESSYARNLCFLLWGQGFQVWPEAQQATGRADLVADHPCGTYIFELKVDQPAAIAMAQATARGYAAPYRAAGKPVWLIGLSFDSATRKLTGHEWQEVTN